MTRRTGLVLSIRQPWAWLIIRPDVTDPQERAALRLRSEIKDIENRDWATRVRGLVGIHAGKRFDFEGYEWVRREFPQIRMPSPDGFRLGGIVGRGDLADCVEEHESPWFCGQYGFVFASSEPLPFIPCRGQLGFFRPEIVQ